MVNTHFITLEGNQWTGTILYSFTGAQMYDVLIPNQDGNLNSNDVNGS